MNYGYGSYTASNYARGLNSSSALSSASVSNAIAVALAGFLGIIIFIATQSQYYKLLGCGKFTQKLVKRDGNQLYLSTI